MDCTSPENTNCDPKPPSDKVVESSSPATGSGHSLQSLPSSQESQTLPSSSALSRANRESSSARTSSRRHVELLPNRYRSHEQPARLSTRVCKAAANAVVEGLEQQLVTERIANPRLSRQVTNDSVQSLDVSVRANQKQRFTKNEILAMRSTSILDLLHNDTKGEFRKKLKDTFAHGLSKNSCHALDLAGKVPFGLLMQSIGVNHKELYVDSALSGGLYSSADAFIPGSGTFLEIKSAKLKAGTEHQFQIKKIGHLNTSWKYLIIVCRTKQPKDWLNPDEYNRCCFWVGVVDRKTYMERLMASRWKDRSIIHLTVTPGTGAASNGSYSSSWLGDYIKWTKFEDIKDISWWKETFP